jgi:hypothetical protein
LEKHAEGKENAQTECPNSMNDDLRLLKAGDDYWKQAVHAWA